MDQISRMEGGAKTPRVLPIVVIGGEEFYVDAAREELWQVRNPANQIPFGDFYPEGDGGVDGGVDGGKGRGRHRSGYGFATGFKFLYHIKRCCPPSNSKELWKNLKQYYWVSLPALNELDPEGIALRYNIPIECLTGQVDMAKHSDRVSAAVSRKRRTRKLIAKLKQVTARDFKMGGLLEGLTGLDGLGAFGGKGESADKSMSGAGNGSGALGWV